MLLYNNYFIYITIYVFIKTKVLVIFYCYYPLIVFLGLILYADLFIFLINTFLFVLSIKYLLYPFFLLQFYYFFNSLFRHSIIHKSSVNHYLIMFILSPTEFKLLFTTIQLYQEILQTLVPI